MGYQVLARKWRPRSFGEMVGQEHVLKALINALDHNRLHHAFLFTGTRGVGKTTVARILAKCLNCETGISSTPCGVCSACTDISEGRFVDLIEVDAASRTKVEDTRELLDNVQYSPTSGRFKIYLIDEVHMLSNSSFNALLKTLEEPPEHVKFLLATTDPQKLPATILSRCLQFNLKNMSPERIVGHLQHVLGEELIPFEESALWQLARSADGSMRDALSLTDQAIAFGNGKLSERDVSNMLGTIDHNFIHTIIDGLIEGDGSKILSSVALFAEHSPDYSAALGDIQTTLHRIAIAQALPEALDNSFGDRDKVLTYATKIAPEDVQLFYQTALMGQKDLSLCSVMRTGFEMCLLRMLAFKPQGLVDIPEHRLVDTVPKINTAPGTDISKTDSTTPRIENDIPGKPEPTSRSEVEEGEPPSEKKRERQLAEQDSGTPTPAALARNQNTINASALEDATTPVETETLVGAEQKTLDHTPKNENLVAEKNLQTRQSELQDSAKVARPQKDKVRLEDFQAGHWVQVFSQLGLSGVLKMTTANLKCLAKNGSRIEFHEDSLAGVSLDKSNLRLLEQALSEYFGQAIAVDIGSKSSGQELESPAEYAQRSKRERRARALTEFKNDPVVLALQRELDAVLDEMSIEIIEEN